jgi:hypothetical protein
MDIGAFNRETFNGQSDGAGQPVNCLKKDLRIFEKLSNTLSL